MKLLTALFVLSLSVTSFAKPGHFKGLYCTAVKSTKGFPTLMISNISDKEATLMLNMEFGDLPDTRNSSIQKNPHNGKVLATYIAEASSYGKPNFMVLASGSTAQDTQKVNLFVENQAAEIAMTCVDGMTL